jgi:hypothetical protein
MRRLLAIPFVLSLAGACVPPDNALALGSVEITVRATAVTRQGVPANITRDAWDIRFEKALLSYKSATIGDETEGDTCSYRGQAQRKNAVFDLREGIVQSFNGLLPGVCGDVGAIFGPPDGDTVPVAGATAEDLVDLASGDPAHMLVRAVGTRGDETYTVILRFDTARTSSKLAGCRSSGGVRIKPEARTSSTLLFAGDQLFRDGLSMSARVRFQPFTEADFDGDHVITMDELDRLPLSTLQIYSEGYLLGPAGNGSLGDFVRGQFRFAWLYDLGSCRAKEPGVD